MKVPGSSGIDEERSSRSLKGSRNGNRMGERMKEVVQKCRTHLWTMVCGCALVCSACTSIEPEKNQDFSLLEREAHRAMMRGNLKEAERLDLRALSIVPKDATVMNNLAVVKDRLGEHSGALQILENAHRISPNNPTILMNLARVQLKNGKEDEAYRTAGQIIPMSKWPTGFRTLMGKIDIDLGRYGEAHIYLHEANERHPDNPLILTYLGIVHFRIGDAEEGKKDFVEAISKKPPPRLKRALERLLRNPSIELGISPISANRRSKRSSGHQKENH